MNVKVFVGCQSHGAVFPEARLAREAECAPFVVDTAIDDRFSFREEEVFVFRVAVHAFQQLVHETVEDVDVPENDSWVMDMV